MNRAGTYVMPLLEAMSSQLPADRGGLALVFYHVDLQSNSPFDRLRAGVRPDYHRMIELSLAAARAVHPEATIIMLTDAVTGFNQPWWCHVVRLPLVAARVGLERTRAQMALAAIWQGPVVHLDTDMFVRRRFDETFATGFDIGLTWRPEIPRWPINGGMLLCGAPTKFLHFMVDMVANLERIAKERDRPPGKGPCAEDLLCAGAEQYALAEMVVGRGVGEYVMRWGRLRIFDCEQLNRTTEEFYSGAPELGPVVEHLKGYRKRALAESSARRGD